jgi:hypothetical protein
MKLTDLLLNASLSRDTPSERKDSTRLTRQIDWKTRCNKFPSLSSSSYSHQHDEHQLRHSDLYQLSEIAFGQCDLHIRLNAIQQLNILLVREDVTSLLSSTSDQEWCLKICQLCLEVASHFDWHAPPPRVPHPSSSPRFQQEPFEADSSLFSIQGIILLRNILLSVPSLRPHLGCSFNLQGYTSPTSGPYLDLTPIVISILKYRLLASQDQNTVDNSRVSLDHHHRHREFFHLFCSEIVILFSSSLYDSSLWTRTQSKISSIIPRTDRDFGSHTTPSTKTKINFQLPSFLWDDLLAVNPDQDLLYLYQKYAVNILCSSVILHFTQRATHLNNKNNNDEDDEREQSSPKFYSFHSPPKEDRS